MPTGDPYYTPQSSDWVPPGYLGQPAVITTPAPGTPPITPAPPAGTPTGPAGAYASEVAAYGLCVNNCVKPYASMGAVIQAIMQKSCSASCLLLHPTVMLPPSGGGSAQGANDGLTSGCASCGITNIPGCMDCFYEGAFRIATYISVNVIVLIVLVFAGWLLLGPGGQQLVKGAIGAGGGKVREGVALAALA